MLETFERKVKDGMKSLTHPKVLNHSAELSLNENMKNNSFGTNFNNISKGYNGEVLILFFIFFNSISLLIEIRKDHFIDYFIGT